MIDIANLSRSALTFLRFVDSNSISWSDWTKGSGARRVSYIVIDALKDAKLVELGPEIEAVTFSGMCGVSVVAHRYVLTTAGRHAVYAHRGRPGLDGTPGQ